MVRLEWEVQVRFGRRVRHVSAAMSARWSLENISKEKNSFLKSTHSRWIPRKGGHCRQHSRGCGPRRVRGGRVGRSCRSWWRRSRPRPAALPATTTSGWRGQARDAWSPPVINTTDGSQERTVASLLLERKRANGDGCAKMACTCRARLMDQRWHSQDHKPGGTHGCPCWSCSSPEKYVWG